MTTTRAHYEKYRRMQDYLPVELQELLCPIQALRRLFMADPLLNNIPLARFDALYPAVRHALQEAGVRVTMAESVCALKHMLVYRCLGEKPRFIE
jgi:hypothetical protein